MPNKKSHTITQEEAEKLVANIEALNGRVAELEAQMLVCLEFMARKAEGMAAQADPNFKPLDPGSDNN